MARNGHIYMRHGNIDARSDAVIANNMVGNLSKVFEHLRNL